MGRWMLLAVVVALAGCAQPAARPTCPNCAPGSVYQPPAELVADFDRRNAAAVANLPPSTADVMTPAEARAVAERARRDDQARAICRARGSMAGAAMPTLGSSVNAAAAGGVWGAVANAQTEAACLDAYRATGILPIY